MQVIPARIEDAAEIASVHVRSWQAAYASILSQEFLASLSIEGRTAQWTGILGRRESQTFVARSASRVSGFISFGHWRDAPAARDQGEVWALYAEPEVWGTGVGRTLLVEALGELRTAGRHTVHLWVLRDNARGIRFYRAAGFLPAPIAAKVLEIGGRRVEEVRLTRGEMA